MGTRIIADIKVDKETGLFTTGMWQGKTTVDFKDMYVSKEEMQEHISSIGRPKAKTMFLAKILMCDFKRKRRYKNSAKKVRE